MIVWNNEYDDMNEIEMPPIDYYKYLKCPDCVDSGLYCKAHRIEVEQILNSDFKKKLV